MSPSTDFVQQQEEEKKIIQRQEKTRRGLWTVCIVAMLINCLVLTILGVKAPWIGFVVLILLVAAIALDRIETHRQKEEAAMRAAARNADRIAQITTGHGHRKYFTDR